MSTRWWAAALLVANALVACDGQPRIIPYPHVASSRREVRPVARPPSNPAVATPATSVAPTPPSFAEAPQPLSFRGIAVAGEVDRARPPVTLPPGARRSLGPGGEIVVDAAGREAWIAGGETEEVTGSPYAHARVTSDLPPGLRLLPVLDLEERGCFSGWNFALFDPRAGRAYTEGREPDLVEPAPGAPIDAGATVVLRYVRRGPVSHRERLLYGPREAVEAAPSGAAPGGWLLRRGLARFAGEPISSRQRTDAAPGMTYATLRPPAGSALGRYRFWMRIDGRPVEAFDAELEYPETGLGGMWRRGDRALIWLWDVFDSMTFMALVDVRTGRPIGPPVSLTVDPDWDPCSAAGLHDNRVLAVLDGDDLSYAFLSNEGEDETHLEAILYGPNGGMGRVVSHKLPNVEDAAQLPPVLRFTPCAAGQCLAQAPGALVAGEL